MPAAGCHATFDLQPRTGEPPPVTISVDATGSLVSAALRPRVSASFPISIDLPLSKAHCTFRYDSSSAGSPTNNAAATFRFRQEPAAGTRVVVESLTMDDLEAGDIDITGSLVCSLADFAVPIALFALHGQIEPTTRAAVQHSIDGLVCGPPRNPILGGLKRNLR